MKLPVRYFMFCFKRQFFSCKFISIFCFVLVIVELIHIIIGNDVGEGGLIRSKKLKSTTLRTPVYLNAERLKEIMINKRNNNLEAESKKMEMKMKWWKEKINKLNQKNKPKMVVREIKVNRTLGINYNVHIFYYAWYENIEVDGGWQHWNHEYLSNWRTNDLKQYPKGNHNPPDDIGSNFYPKLGCYSSRDSNVVDQHMKMISDACIGVIIVSWYPPGMSDGKGRSSDTVFSQLLNAADKYKLKVAPHIEPYKDRNPENFLQHVKYFRRTYGNHPALYKKKKGSRELIVYYVYDSYRTPAKAWRELLSPAGNITLRETPDDGIFLGLVVDMNHKVDIQRGKFDGFYTYFASNGFSYGSTWKNWKILGKFAHFNELMFIPSVGPGYIDTRVRPWNAANTRHRRNGKYYDVGWRTAILADVNQVSITSFNEWHEGTQIEPAVPKTTQNFTYLDYEPEGPDFYMNLTKFWINEFDRKSFQVPIF